MAKSAAQAIWGNLPSGEREPIKQRERSLGDALWPQLSREAKQRGRDQQLWDEICKRQRDNFLRGWREQRGERGR
jgi:hypothetical protein